MRKTRQPFERRRREMCRSRVPLRAILCCQYSRFARGIRQCKRQPCQKQPSTKIATRCRRNTKSGRPGIASCRRQPESRAARRMDASLTSVSLFPRDGTAAMTCERLCFENTSAIFRLFHRDRNIGICLLRQAKQLRGLWSSLKVLKRIGSNTIEAFARKADPDDYKAL
jgi:hypothetical protein